MLVIVPVTTLADAMRLREIRNECRAGYSHDNSEITEAQQVDWWTKNCHIVKAWLYYLDGNAQPFGYTLARLCGDNKWWGSCGVRPAHQGGGLGRAIVHDMVCRVPGIWGEARIDNPAAVRLHCTADWDEVPCDNPKLRRFHAKCR